MDTISRFTNATTEEQALQNRETFGDMLNRALEQERHVAVNKPPHYRAHPSGVECIQITEHMSFNLGNAVKYIWRADLKGKQVEDLKKAVWYINREIERINNGS